MKKFILLITVIFAFVGMQAQDLSKLITMKSANTLYEVDYTDLELDGTVDSCYFTIIANKPYPIQWTINVDVDTVAGADTTYTYQLYGKVFDENSWTQISTTTASALAAAATISLTSITSPTSTFAADSTSVITSGYANYYRYLQIRIIRTGDDSTGGGIDIDAIRLKFWERKY